MARAQILHVDMNAFYASCHQAQNSDLRRKPLLVGGDPRSRRGIVLTASYEARRFGVKTAMTIGEALRLCPQALIVEPDHELYSWYSGQIMTILRSFTPAVEQYSIDEAWLDVSGCKALFGSPSDIAQKIKQEIRNKLGLTCSIGVAPTKIVAKMASNLQKPDGLVIINAGDIKSRLWPLAVRNLVGVGAQTATALNNMGIFTIGDLAQFPTSILKEQFGVYGPYLRQLARGQDHSQVNPKPDRAKSIGNSITLPRDISAADEVERVLLALAEEVGTRMRRQGLIASTVTVSIKTPNFKLITRSRTYPDATNFTDTIYRRAATIYQQHLIGRRVRLVGISLSTIESEDAKTQLNLFPDDDNEKRARLTQVVDQVRARFGKQALVRARLLQGPYPDKK